MGDYDRTRPLVIDPQLSVELSVTSTGDGTVRSLPAGIDCGPPCNWSYDPGAIVQLTAIPGFGSYFNGWSGDCASQSLTCLLTMDTDKTATVDFTTTPPAVTTWTKTYGGTNDDFVSSIQQTSDGGYVVVGSTFSFGAGYEDAWIMKLNNNGTVAWQTTMLPFRRPAM